jgi:hypothetical protein
MRDLFRNLLAKCEPTVLLRTGVLFGRDALQRVRAYAFHGRVALLRDRSKRVTRYAGDGGRAGAQPYRRRAGARPYEAGMLLATIFLTEPDKARCCH